MFTWVSRLLDRISLRSIREHEVARYGAISIADFRGAGEAFRTDIVQALQLVSEHDARRFGRVQRTCRFVVNHPIPRGSPATYSNEWNACLMDYDMLRGIEPAEFRQGCIACLLVHEATHGLIERRKIRYVGDNRLRIEQLCMREQNRFAARLTASAPGLYSGLQMDFRDSDWTSRWAQSSLVALLSYLRHLWRNRRN